MREFTFTINISADGTKVQGLVQGIAGQGCEGIAGLLDAIGPEIEHKCTDEYDEPEPVALATGETIQAGNW